MKLVALFSVETITLDYNLSEGPSVIQCKIFKSNLVNVGSSNELTAIQITIAMVLQMHLMFLSPILPE